MRFTVLGPLEASWDGRPIPLGGAKQRSVLALLLVDANRVVSVDRLVSSIWDGLPDERLRGTVQVHVSNLRKALRPAAEALGSPEIIVTKAPGYQVSLTPQNLDLLEFEALMKRARAAALAGDASSASSLYGEALDLWKGTPLGDLQNEPFARRIALRLHTQRMRAVEGRLEAELAAGRHGEVVSELEDLVAANPLNEQFVGLLMLALYRCGRQADALAVFRECRRWLSDELGLDPKPELRALERKMLAQDPSLDVAQEQEDTGLPTALPEAGGVRGTVEINGLTFDLVNQVTSIGRKKDRHIVVEDPMASRRHAEIVKESGRFRLKDLNSTNGTRLNGVSVTEHLLANGDEISIGETVLLFRQQSPSL